MDTDTARLIGRAAHLPIPDLFTVYDAATPAEQAALRFLIERKMRVYFKQLSQSLPPTQWRNDPTYARLREMFPDEVPF